ncbi:MAG: response regulator [candidate division KSB1 bacterium]|nr:response regulator [candidate division KSB1 bacterium]MDQ7063165.1 response regulator [candidate division KSB1 bacterium]
MMENVLIVDDEDDILHLMAEAISRWGYNPIIAHDGQDAIQKVEELPVDLILTDVRMPKVDGISLLQKVKEINPDTSVIVFTGYPAIQSAVDALKSGAYDYLVKPVDLAELKNKIEKAIQAKRLQGTYGVLKSINWALIISIPLWFLLAFILVRTM